MSAFICSVTGLAADQAEVVVNATLLFGRQELAVLLEEGLISGVVTIPFIENRFCMERALGDFEVTLP